MQVNTESLVQCPLFIHYIYGGIIEVALAIVLLWFYIGASAFIGLAAFILLTPFNSLFSKLYSDAELEKLEQKDTKVKIINEVLNGMKVRFRYIKNWLIFISKKKLKNTGHKILRLGRVI